MNKPFCVISAPVETYSGYGAKSRDFCKALIELKDKEWDIKILPMPWGSCKWGFVEDHLDTWGFLKNYFLPNNVLDRRPDIYIPISVSNEFQPFGAVNIGVTSGVECTKYPAKWLEGLNRMTFNIVSSNFTKEVCEQTLYDIKDKNTNQPSGQLKLEKPIYVLPEGVDLDVYDKDVNGKILDGIVKEKFAFLFVGHWLKGDIGEDRKNVGKLIKIFFETFKNTTNQPALVMKMGADGSIWEQEGLLQKINQIRKTCKGKLPNIYLITGDLTNEEMNELYRCPKVKAMVSFTKGEGYGRPLAEFALTKKPIITSNWSGHIDFIKPEFSILIGGQLTNIHKSAAWKGVLDEDGQWFSIDEPIAAGAMKDVFKNYNNYLEKTRKSRQFIRDNFSYDAMKIKLNEILNQIQVSVQQPLNMPGGSGLPKLQKVGSSSKPSLPKLQKVGGEDTNKLKLPKLTKVT